MLTPPFRYRIKPGVTTAEILALSPVAWYRYGVGITESGGLVSQWDDQSGNANHLVQATGTNQPALQADGSILFDGEDNYLKTAGFTLNQPETIYLLMKQITFTANDRFCDGDAGNSGTIRQVSTTPLIDVAAASGSSTDNGNLAIDTWAVVCGLINGSSSLTQVNLTAAVTGSSNITENMGGFTLGGRGDVSSFANIQVKEAILFPAAHDAATRALVIKHLAAVGRLSI